MFTAESIQSEKKIYFSPSSSEVWKEQATVYLVRFFALIRASALFHLSFVLLIALQIFSFFCFFTFLNKSLSFALSIASLFLTTFSYFVLHFYFQTKKPEQMQGLIQDYVNACKGNQTLSAPLFYLADLIHLDKCDTYHFLEKIKAIEPLVKKFKITMHYADLLQMKEWLILRAIDEKIEAVKKEPCDIELHAQLGNAYLALSNLYLSKDGEWTPPSNQFAKLHEKSLSAARKALEEFKILDTFVPNDLWVHGKLAALYHQLHLPEKERLVYETMLKLAPDDKELLFKLGLLYFQQGETAQALLLYDRLKKMGDMRADDLITYYS